MNGDRSASYIFLRVGKSLRVTNVRFAPESGQIADISGCPLCANRVLTHRSEKGNPGQSAKGGAAGAAGRRRFFDCV